MRVSLDCSHPHPEGVFALTRVLTGITKVTGNVAFLPREWNFIYPSIKRLQILFIHSSARSKVRRAVYSPDAASAEQQKCRLKPKKGRFGSRTVRDAAVSKSTANKHNLKQQYIRIFYFYPTTTRDTLSTSLIRISILLLSVAHRYTQSFFLPVLCALSCALSLSLSLSSRQHSKRKTLTLCRGVSPVWCSTVHFHAHLVKELVVCVQDTHTVPILYTVYDAHMTLIDVTSLL